VTDVRSWQQAKLAGDATLVGMLGAGAASVVSVSSFESVPEAKPFVVHRLGLSVPELRDDNRTVTMTTPASYWIHDLPGDYLRIDGIANKIQEILELSTPDSLVIQANWQDTSEELRDPEMGTILRVVRFRLVHKP